MLAWLSPGQVGHRFMDSVTKYFQYDAVHHGRCVIWGGTISMMTSPRIAAARNDIVTDFLNEPSGCEWLMMVDSDMTFEEDAIDTLLEAALEHEAHLVGGLCFGGGRGNKIFPTLYVLTDAEKLTIDRLQAYPDDAMVKVSATGAAFLLIHRKVLEDMYEKFEFTPDGFKNPQPWFRDGVQKGQQFGEDIWFCLAANAAGYPTYVHTGVRIGHEKSWVIQEDDYVDWLKDQHGSTADV